MAYAPSSKSKLKQATLAVQAKCRQASHSLRSSVTASSTVAQITQMSGKCSEWGKQRLDGLNKKTSEAHLQQDEYMEIKNDYEAGD